MIIICKHIIAQGYAAITLYPFIIFKRKEFITLTRLNHERIHLRQQIELLWLGFFFWYAVDFLLKYAKYRSWNKAYKNNVFEREAYANENNLNYLNNRKLFAFLNYTK